MRNPRAFTKSLVVGAPAPMAEIPFKPSRMIHFFDPSNEKMLAKLPEIAKKTDVLLGNLEDAIPADRKEAAREGLVKIGKQVDFGDTALWTRVNSLDSPWFLDDVTRLVGEIGDRLHIEIEDIQKQAARGTVRAGSIRRGQEQGVQRVHAHDAGALTRSEFQQTGEVGEIPDAPIAP